MATPQRKPTTRPSAEAPAPPLRARFFPTTPRVTAQIEEWARSSGARVRAIIPVYTEDTEQ